MELRTLTKLILKLTGAYLLVATLLALPPVLAAPDQLQLGGLVFVVVYVFAGAALLWFPGLIVNRVIGIEGAALEGSASASRLLRVGVVLLGFYFSVSAAYGLVFTWARLNLFYRFSSTFPGASGPEMTADDFGYLVASALQLVLGLSMWFGSRIIVRLSGSFNESC